MTIQAHAQAVLDLLDADDNPPPLVWLDGKVPTGQTLPYVLAYFSFTTLDAEQAPDAVPLETHSDVIEMTVYLHSVGENATAARTVAGRVRTALLGQVPVIAGRVCHPIRHDESQPPQRDESTGSLRMDQIDVYRLRTAPA